MDLHIPNPGAEMPSRYAFHAFGFGEVGFSLSVELMLTMHRDRTVEAVDRLWAVMDMRSALISNGTYTSWRKRILRKAWFNAKSLLVEEWNRLG